MLTFKQYITVSMLAEQAGPTGATGPIPPPPPGFKPQNPPTGPKPSGVAGMAGGSPSTSRGPSQDPNFSVLRAIGGVIGQIRPTAEIAGDITGRLATQGYSTQGTVNRFNTYKSAGGVAAQFAGAAGITGIAGGLGKFQDVLNKAGAFGDEAAVVGTVALYDPRAAGELGYLETVQGITQGARIPPTP